MRIRSVFFLLFSIMLLGTEQSVKAETILIRAGSPTYQLRDLLFPVSEYISNVNFSQTRMVPMWGLYSGSGSGGTGGGIPRGTYFFSCAGTGTQPSPTSIDMMVLPVAFRIADHNFTNEMKVFYATSLQDVQNGNWTWHDLPYSIDSFIGISAHGLAHTMASVDLRPLNITIDQNNSGFVCFSIKMRTHLSMAFAQTTSYPNAMQFLSPFTDVTINGLRQTSSVITDRVIAVFVGNN